MVGGGGVGAGDKMKVICFCMHKIFPFEVKITFPFFLDFRQFFCIPWNNVGRKLVFLELYYKRRKLYIKFQLLEKKRFKIPVEDLFQKS